MLTNRTESVIICDTCDKKEEFFKWSWKVMPEGWMIDRNTSDVFCSQECYDVYEKALAAKRLKSQMQRHQ